MFLLFGLRTRDRVTDVRPQVCEVCGRHAAQTLLRRTTLFTLFFVPVLPVRPARHLVSCAACGTLRRADRTVAGRLVG